MMIETVSVFKLAEFSDFQPDAFKRKFGVDLTLEGVFAAIPQDYIVELNRTTDYHLGRIRFLIENPDDEPIEIDSFCEGGRVFLEPILLDGNHRYFAALLSGQETIPCIFAGQTSLLSHLKTGLVDIARGYSSWI